MNAMQLMHGMYNVHNYLSSPLFSQLWTRACTDMNVTTKYKMLPAPILTRWWSVGVCAATLDEEWDVRERINNSLVNLPPKHISTSLRKVVSTDKNLMRKKEIQSDIKIIVAIHKNWMFEHFDFLQGGDPLTGNVAGYQARMMTVRYFLMHEDLRSCMGGKWKDMEGYKDMYQFNCEKLDIETHRLQEDKVEHTFTHMLDSIEKHFDPWVNRHLPIALFSDSQTVQVVASFLLVI